MVPLFKTISQLFAERPAVLPLTADDKTIVEQDGVVRGAKFSDILAFLTAPIGFVPDTRTVNSHPLSADVTVTKADVGLGNVDNTSDANKPISTATATALASKSNVGHGHVAADVSDFSEAVDDRVAALLVAGTGASLTYNDGANTLTVSALGDLIDEQIFEANGTWTKPSGARVVEIEWWHGGASGASAAAGGASAASCGSGGGPGAYGRKRVLASTLGASVAVTVGAGGVAPAAGANNGNSGGLSQFSGLIGGVAASGGVSTVSTTNNYGVGGAAGTSTGGDENISGDAGGMYIIATAANAFVIASGRGGAAPRGGGGGQEILPANGSQSNGNPGKAPGGGGSGAGSRNGGAAAQGGAGAAGRIIVRSYS